jgi:type I restriction enzyme S subunit
MTTGESVLGDVGTVIDCEHRTAPRSDPNAAHGYSVGTSNVRGGRITLTSAKPVDEATFLQWTRRAVPQPGDLIFSREAPMGEVGEVPPGIPVCLGQRTVLLRVRKDRIDTRFLKYSLMAPASQQWIAENAAGTTVLHLNVADVRQIPLGVLPPLEEQQRIVEILEDHLSRLDAATTYLESAGARQARLVDRYLSAALAALSPPVRPVGELLSQPLINGRSVPTANGGFPVLRLTALQQGRVDLAARKTGAWTAREAAPFLVQQRDFLISRGNGSRRLVGLGGLVVTEPDPVAFPDTLIRIRTKADTVHPEFLALVWNGSDVRRQIEAAAKTTAGIYKINQKDVERVVLPVPTMTQQVGLAADVSAFQDSVERLDWARAAVVSRGQALRRALLAAAFSGRLG